jgi:hypothetical protein
MLLRIKHLFKSNHNFRKPNLNYKIETFFLPIIGPKPLLGNSSSFVFLNISCRVEDIFKGTKRIVLVLDSQIHQLCYHLV